MTAEMILNTPIEAETEQDNGRWIARQRDLALYAYGETPEEASARLMEAMHLLVEVLMEHGGVDAVRRYFREAGIELTMTEKADESHQTFPLTLTLTKSLELAS
jgi:predicted RNase H-like HicB family nuclease